MGLFTFRRRLVADQSQPSPDDSIEYEEGRRGLRQSDVPVARFGPDADVLADEVVETHGAAGEAVDGDGREADEHDYGDGAEDVEEGGLVAGGDGTEDGQQEGDEGEGDADIDIRKKHARKDLRATTKMNEVEQQYRRNGR